MRHSVVFTIICRLMALVLLGQSVLGSVSWARHGDAAEKAKREDSWYSTQKVKDVPATRAKGVPRMKLDPRTPKGHSSNGLNRSDKTDKPYRTQGDKFPTTLLNEVGRLDQKIPQETLRAWKKELGSSKATNERKAWLTLWLGENELASQEPAKASELFDRVKSFCNDKDFVYGLSRYNSAIASFYGGRYREAYDAFRELLKSKLTGFDRRNCALFARHAGACAGYHEEHAKLGIKQPEGLDPLCGAAMVGIWLKYSGLPHDEETLVKKIPHTGEGSTMADLVKGCENLGLKAYPAKATEKGLRALPKPLIAHVEHDHFVSVIEADDSGVKYACSDCGPWPGGFQKLTWKQWRAMEASIFMVIAKPGSIEDQALIKLTSSGASNLRKDTKNFLLETAANPTKNEENSLLAFFTQLPPTKEPTEDPDVEKMLSGLEGEVLAWISPISIVCGEKPESLHCDPCVVVCPLDSSGMPGIGFGPSAGDPVNLATGEEEYQPEADLVVYNPIGPSVNWKRIYNSLSNWHSSFGHSWSHPYNIGVIPHNGFKLGDSEGTIILENNARITYTANNANPPTPGNPVTCFVPNGYPYLVKWHYATSTTYYFTVTLPNRKTWKTQAGPLAGMILEYLFLPIERLTDPSGNFIQFQYATYTLPVYGEVKRLTRIDDSTGQALLTLGLDANGYILSANDRYNRSVYYRVSEYATEAFPPYHTFYMQVDQISQVVPTGTPSPPLRYEYTYQLEQGGHNRVPFLKTISVPSPTGTGMTTSTLHYKTSLAFIDKVVDANGNQRIYEEVALNRTRVTVKDSLNNTIYLYTVTFNSNMSASAVHNASGQLVASYAYADPDDPFKPSSITDGNNRTTYFDWDQYGNLLSKTTNKGTTTYFGYTYTDFPLGQLDWAFQGTKTPTYFTYYQPSGLVQTVSTPIPGEAGTGNVQTTTYTYDSLGNVLTVARPGNNAASTRTMTFNYTTDGGYSQPAAIGQPLTMTDELSHVWHFRYDSRGNLTRSWDPLGNSDTDFEYNLANQRTITRLQATGNTGPGRAYSQSTYLYTAGPATQVNAYNESGVLFRTINFSYGFEGEMLTRTGSTEHVTLEYDATYRTKVLRDGRSNPTSYTYNTNGYLSEVLYPAGGGDKVRYTSFDPVGNVLQRIDGNGAITNYLYEDLDGLLSSVSYPATPSLNVSLTYDAYNRLSSASDGSGTQGKTYDDLNNTLTSTTTYTGLSAKTLSYQYYPDGSRQQLNLAGSGLVNYLYDAAGRPQTMTHPLGSASWAHFDNNWTQRRTLNGVAYTDYLYNPIGLLTRLTNKNSAGTVTHSDYTSFTYDGVFNLTGLTASVPGTPSYSGTSTFGYDTKDRLTGDQSTKQGSYSYNFEYDLASNPTTWKGQSQSFNSNNQQTGAPFVYDFNGNPTTYKSTSCTFNPENRLTAYGSILTAGYRADGMRAWKQNSSGRTYFIYDKNKPVLELDASGNVVSTNLFAHEGLIARRQGATDIYYLFDQQGNVSHRLNSSGAILSSSTFDAYGLETRTSDQGDPFGFNAKWGYYKDTETGLYLCTWRYYDPEKGRWLIRDPIGYLGGINLYGYCYSNSVFRKDPTGLLRETLPRPVPVSSTGAGAVIGGGAAAAGAELAIAAGIGVGVGYGIYKGADYLTGGGYSEAVASFFGIGGPDELPGDPRFGSDPCAPVPDELRRALEELGLWTDPAGLGQDQYWQDIEDTCITYCNGVVPLYAHSEWIDCVEACIESGASADFRWGNGLPLGFYNLGG